MPRRTVKGSGKKIPLNMRTTEGLREKINRAAGESGRSLVQEVEHRVEKSFWTSELWPLLWSIAEDCKALRCDVRRQDESLLKLVQVLEGLPLQLRPQDRKTLQAMLNGSVSDDE